MIDEREIEIAVKIPFDEERVNSQGVYDLEKMKKRLNLLFLNARLNIQTPGYMFTNARGQSRREWDPAFWGTIAYLKRCRWLMTNIKDMQIYIGGYEDLKKDNYESLFDAMKKTGNFYTMDKYWWSHES